MIKKYSILVGVMVGTLLLIISTIYYPGGNSENVNSEGYDWVNNYISNLLRPLAVNGEENTARPIAIFGILLLSASFGFFFVNFARKIKIRSASLVIKYLGLLATTFGFVTVIPSMHDIMVTLSSILTLLIFFYITVIVIKSKLTMMKIMSIVFLLTFYFGAYMYFSRFQLEFMPVMQKIIFVMKIAWVLSLEYLTRKEDFEHIIK
jgi:hypothetical protein|tara:strand:+ start:126201 stop:126818 length:618 start_codon:yes stop_codon:yes gene_type:complete